jgi:inosine-uridine nucleoside N-ribohydrolase
MGDRGGNEDSVAQKIIIDCDPGVDDALALAFAHGDPGLAVCGITTVAGNVGLDKTTANALRVRDFIGMGDVPVVPGSAGPLLRPVLDARDIHGDNGLAGARLPAALSGPAPGHAVDYLIETISAAPGEITLVAIGPLTNIALAVRREPALTTLVREFVIMGGSAGRGNRTPAAEFNILADPESAAIVFSAGWTVTMIGLDVTLQPRATAAVRERMRGLGRLADDLLLPSLAGYRTIGPADSGPADSGPADSGPAVSGPAGPGDTGSAAEPGWPDDLADPAVHDVCAVARVTRPDLITCVPALVQVETAGRLTSGMTVTDFGAPAAQHNAMVGTGVDVDGFWDLVMSAYQRVAAGMAGRSLPGQ